MTFEAGAGAAPPAGGNSGQAAPPASAPAAGAPPAAGAAPNGAGGQAPAAAAATTYRPEGLPEHLYGPSDRETLDRVVGDWKKYRVKEAERGVTPSKAEDYKFEWSEPLKPYAANWEKSEFDQKFLGKVRAAGFEFGVGDKQLNGVINRVLGEMVAGDMVEKPLDVAAERKALIPEGAAALPEAEQRAAVDKRMNDNMAWLEAMSKRATNPLPAAAKDFMLAQLGDRANGHIGLEWLRAQIGGEGGVQPLAGGQAGTVDSKRAALIARQTDPRANNMAPTYDPKFVAETMELYKQAEKEGWLTT